MNGAGGEQLEGGAGAGEVGPRLGSWRRHPPAVGGPLQPSSLSCLIYKEKSYLASFTSFS